MGLKRHGERRNRKNVFSSEQSCDMPGIESAEKEINGMDHFTLGTMYWLNPGQDAAGMEDDCRKIREDGYDLVRIIVWWEIVEQVEKQYDFSYVDRFFRAAEKHGLQVMCTIGFYPPYWLTCRLDALGKNDPGRYPSLLRPEVCEPLSRLIAALTERYRTSPALVSWNVWNEPTLNVSKHPLMMREFADWLKRKYPSYELLLQNWRGEYPVLSLLMPNSWEELDADWLSRAFRLGSRGRISAMEYDFWKFCPEEMCREIRWLCDEIRKQDKTHPTHANLHSVNGNPVTAGRDFYRTARIPDTISCSIHQSNDNPGNPELRFRWGFYDCAIARTRSWRKDDCSMVGELQIGTSDIHIRKYTPTPETVFYELWAAYAEDLSGVIHWEWNPWRAGTFELGEFCLRSVSGDETPRSRAVKRFAEIFRRNQAELLHVRRERAEIAILDSFSNGIYRYLQWKDHQNAPDIGSDYQNAVLGCFRALNEANLPVEFVSEEEIAGGILSNYKVLYLPETVLLGADVAKMICRFVQSGGSVWADARFGWLDEHMYLRDVIPGHGMDSIFGGREIDYTAAPEAVSAQTSDGTSLTGRTMRQVFTPYENGRVYARYADGAAAAVESFPGKGHARIWGLELSRALCDVSDPATEREIVGFALESGVKPELELPYGITGRILHGCGYDVAVLHNRTDAPLSWTMPFRVETLCSDSLIGNVLTLQTGATEVLIIKQTN